MPTMADDGTNALIAKLLSEDNAYADYYDDDAPCTDDTEGSDADFGSSRKPMKIRKGMKVALILHGRRTVPSIGQRPMLSISLACTACAGAAAPRPPPEHRSGRRREQPHGTLSADEPAAGTGSRGAAAEQEVTASGRRKRKDTGAAREKGRSWSEEEERLFQEALDIHGAL